MTKLRDIIRGDTHDIPVTFTESDGTPIDLTGGKVFLTINASKSPADDSLAEVSKSYTSFTSPTTGFTYLTLDPSDTDDITPGTYYYDIQFVSSVGDVLSKKQDTITFIADITRRTT